MTISGRTSAKASAAAASPPPLRSPLGHTRSDSPPKHVVSFCVSACVRLCSSAFLPLSDNITTLVSAYREARPEMEESAVRHPLHAGAATGTRNHGCARTTHPALGDGGGQTLESSSGVLISPTCGFMPSLFFLLSAALLVRSSRTSACPRAWTTSHKSDAANDSRLVLLLPRPLGPVFLLAPLFRLLCASLASLCIASCLQRRQ